MATNWTPQAVAAENASRAAAGATQKSTGQKELEAKQAANPGMKVDPNTYEVLTPDAYNVRYGGETSGTTPITGITPTAAPTTTGKTPNPQTATVTPPNGTVPYDQALKGLQTGGLKGQDLTNATNVLKGKYGVALDNLQKTGGTAPDTAGPASAAVNKSLTDTAPTPEAPPNPMIPTLTQSPEYQQLLADHTAYMNSVNQRPTLTQEYQSLSQSLGLPALNTELMDMKKVIDGTEDDLRTEITKAGGFATNSQVLALASARNKVLIKNYNNLLETRNNAQQQLTTLIGLSEKDRANADAQFKEQLNFDQQMVSYRQKAIDNSKSIYQTLLTNPNYGAKAILAATGGDPSTTQMIEQSLGLSPGGLQGLASKETSALSHVQLSDGSDVMVDKQGNIVKTIGGPTPKKALKGSDVPFTPTQANKGASNAGLSTKDFKNLGHDVQNYFVNTPKSYIDTFKSDLASVKDGSKTAQEVKDTIDTENVTDNVKEYLKGLIDDATPSVAPHEDNWFDKAWNFVTGKK